jgi:hypothetical protein
MRVDSMRIQDTSNMMLNFESVLELDDKD